MCSSRARRGARSTVRQHRHNTRAMSVADGGRARTDNPVDLIQELNVLRFVRVKCCQHLEQPRVASQDELLPEAPCWQRQGAWLLLGTLRSRLTLKNAFPFWVITPPLARIEARSKSFAGSVIMSASPSIALSLNLADLPQSQRPAASKRANPRGTQGLINHRALLPTYTYQLSRRRAPPPALECPGECSATA